MQKLFAQKLEDLRRLIDDSRSASFPHDMNFADDAMSGMKMSGCGERQVRYLLAVSGGMDSMCMLDLFSKVLPSGDFAVAHCNFSLRGEESDGDQALVQEYASKIGVEVFVQKFDTETYARKNGVSIEMAARELRYGWFAQLCAEQGFDVVVVAHNANDNAETLMLNMLRGTGLNGLHGMAELSDVAVNVREAEADLQSLQALGGPSSYVKSVTVFRPLLEFTRKQIEGYVFAGKVPYRHDSSNFESDYKRNRIRNEIFPVFEKINPSFVRTLNREIGYFAEAGDIVEDWCRSQMPNVTSYVDSNVRVDTTALLATKNWRYLLYHILSPYGFNQQTLASIESLLTSSRTIPGKRFESPTHILLTARGYFTVLSRLSASVNEKGAYGMIPSNQNLSVSVGREVLDRKRLDGKQMCREVSNIDTLSQEEDRQLDAIGIFPPPGRGRGPACWEGANGVLCLSDDVTTSRTLSRPADGATKGVNGVLCLSDDVTILRAPGIYNFNGSRFKVELIAWTSGMPLKQPSGTLILDADKLPLPIVCRKWRQGDWFTPLGMKGKKKVSDLFTDLKYDTLAKESSVIMVDTQTEGLAEQQHIAGILGVRIDERYKVTKSTQNVIRLTILDN